MLTHPELIVLPEQECLRRLAHGGIGRVAFDEPDGPVVFPVNFVFHDGCAWMRTGRGELWAAAGADAPACLEIDGVDPLYHGGWNVVVRGPLRRVEDPADLATAQALSLRAWIRRDEFVRLVARQISGRRLLPPV